MMIIVIVLTEWWFAYQFIYGWFNVAGSSAYMTSIGRVKLEQLIGNEAPVNGRALVWHAILANA